MGGGRKNIPRWSFLNISKGTCVKLSTVSSIFYPAPLELVLENIFQKRWILLTCVRITLLFLYEILASYTQNSLNGKLKVLTKNQLLALFFQFNENFYMDAKKKSIKRNENVHRKQFQYKVIVPHLLRRLAIYLTLPWAQSHNRSQH